MLIGDDVGPSASGSERSGFRLYALQQQLSARLDTRRLYQGRLYRQSLLTIAPMSKQGSGFFDYRRNGPFCR
jgi:hypothetical protein